MNKYQFISDFLMRDGVHVFHLMRFAAIFGVLHALAYDSESSNHSGTEFRSQALLNSRAN